MPKIASVVAPAGTGAQSGSDDAGAGVANAGEAENLEEEACVRNLSKVSPPLGPARKRPVGQKTDPNQNE